MRLTNAMFTSQTNEWETPQDLFKRLNSVFRFNLDVCAISTNKKCERFFAPYDDGLKQEWTGVCWMNPPYGREIGKWVKKAYESGLNGATVVCLLPARTDTKWWHEYVIEGEIYFLKGRLKFSNAKNPAPFPCAIVIFRPSLRRIFQYFEGASCGPSSIRQA